MEQLESHRYDCAFATLPEPTLIVGEDETLLLVNAAGEALLGPEVSAAARGGAAVGIALPWLDTATARVLAGEDEVTLETTVPTPGGTRCVAARLRRVRERGGAGCGVLAVLEDVTRRRALEARQRSAVRIAALGSLAADLAHEVNNPLACVVAGLSFVEAEHARIASALGPAELVEAKLALEEARDAALRVRRAVQSLQSLGRPAMPLVHEVDVADVLRAALRLAEPDLRGRARLVMEIEGVRARTSESLLVEVFLGLLVDAARAAEPADGNAVRVKLSAENGEACVAVSVECPAGSVPRREAPPPGARPSFPSTRSLPFAQGTVAALGGSLSLDRSPDGAATATVRLPLDAV